MAPVSPRVVALPVLVGSLLSALVAGCGPSSGSAAPDEDSTVVWATAASGEPTAPASPSPEPATLSLAFAGDVHFTGRTARLLNTPATAFGPIASVLAEADLTILNLETAVTTRGTPEPKTYRFRAPPATFEALRAAGIDAVSLANNHTLDYGQVGFADTLAAAERAEFPVFGAGRNAAEANAPWITTVRGTRIAVLGFSQIRSFASTWVATDTRPGMAMAWDVERAVAAVAAARLQADLVIVYNHWGKERDGCPTVIQQEFAGHLARAGADLIIGSHAHTLQGDGFLGSAYVAYGLGNFLWYGSSASTETGVLRLTVRGRSVLTQELVPAVVSGTGQPVVLTGASATKLTQRFAGLRACAGLADQPA